MKAVIDLLEQYQPGYARTISGAPEWSIELLADAAGVVLPLSYREFCRTIGAGAGPFLDGLSPYHPEELADLYHKATWLPRGRHLLIFGDASPTQAHYFMDLETPYGENDRAVVRCAIGPQGVMPPRSQWESLQEMLLVRAVDQVCLPSCLYRLRFVDGEGEWSKEGAAPDNLVELLTNMSFAKHPGVANPALFLRDDLAILLGTPARPHRPWSCVAAFRDQSEMKRLQALFADYTPLSLSASP